MLTLASPAKINFFLKIIRKRPDGYHELASLFQTIDLCDEISIGPATDDNDTFSCSDPSLPHDHTNLVMKAIHLFRRKSGIKSGFNIHLNKKIPHSAGLGGGSGNAATALWACNQLTKGNFSDNQLAAWSAEIGSDIPFFFSHGTAYCTGRGEVVRDLPAMPPLLITLVKPSQGLSTPQIYSCLNAQNLLQRAPEKILSKYLAGEPEYFNDLEAPAFEIFPELAELKEKLIANGFSKVVMSGSGSSLFCLGNGIVPSDKHLSVYKHKTFNRTKGSWFKIDKPIH